MIQLKCKELLSAAGPVQSLGTRIACIPIHRLSRDAGMLSPEKTAAAAAMTAECFPRSHYATRSGQLNSLQREPQSDANANDCQVAQQSVTTSQHAQVPHDNVVAEVDDVRIKKTPKKCCQLATNARKNNNSASPIANTKKHSTSPIAADCTVSLSRIVITDLSPGAMKKECEERISPRRNTPVSARSGVSPRARGATDHDTMFGAKTESQSFLLRASVASKAVKKECDKRISPRTTPAHPPDVDASEAEKKESERINPRDTLDNTCRDVNVSVSPCDVNAAFNGEGETGLPLLSGSFSVQTSCDESSMPSASIVYPSCDQNIFLGGFGLANRAALPSLRMGVVRNHLHREVGGILRRSVRSHAAAQVIVQQRRTKSMRCISFEGGNNDASGAGESVSSFQGQQHPGLKKVGRARNCNFLTGTEKFLAELQQTGKYWAVHKGGLVAY